MSALREHPAAAIFPLMEGADFADLVADIKVNGLRDPIKTWHDMILDGRNRLRACEAAGIEPRFEEWIGDDPVAFVISCNLHRRHLNAVQRASAAAKLALIERGRPIENKNAHRCAFIEQPEAARLMNVSRNSVQNARTILDKGTPSQIEAMERGKLPLRPTAEKLRHPEDQSARRGPRADRLAPYNPETQRQRERAQGQKDRMVSALSTIRGLCTGLAEFDIGMALSACTPDEIQSWSEIARSNARVLTRLALHLERTPSDETAPH